MQRRASFLSTLFIVYFALCALHCAIALALPADCLVYGEVRDIGTLCSRSGEILGRLDGRTTPEVLLSHLGGKIHSPALAGVDLSVPAHFWMLDPHKYTAPWVYAIRHTDHEAFEAGLDGWYAESTADAQNPVHHLRPPLAAARFLGYQFHVTDRVLLCTDTRAATAVAQWLQSEMQRAKPEMQFRCSGQITLRLDVQRILAVYGKEYAVQVEEMKSRMREAIERLGQRPDAEAGIVAAQKELDRFATLVRDVSDVDIAFRMEPECATLVVDVQAVNGSILDRAVRAHPRGSTGLLMSCPAQATMVLCTNLSAAEAVGNMLLRAVGSSALDALRQAVAPESSMMVALMMTPEPNRVAQILEVRDGVTEAATWARWDRFAAAEGAQPPAGTPFALRALPLPEGAPAGTRLAAVQLDQKLLGAAAARAVGRLFGATPLVAQRFAFPRSMAAVALDPLALLARIDDFVKHPDQTLGSDPSLRQTLAGLPSAPNVLLYASPTGVRAWLALGGFKCGAPVAGELGFAGTVSLTEQGRVIGALRVPTGALKEALGSREQH